MKFANEEAFSSQFHPDDIDIMVDIHGIDIHGIIWLGLVLRGKVPSLE